MCLVENRSSQKNPEVLYCEEGDFQLDRVSNPPRRPPARRPRLLSREYAVCMFVPPSLCPCPGGRDRNGGPVCSFYVPPALLWSRMMECTSRAKASGAPRALYIIVRIDILCIYALYLPPDVASSAYLKVEKRIFKVYSPLILELLHYKAFIIEVGHGG